MRKKLLGMTVAVICGVAVYVAGYAFGEIKGHRSVNQMYSQGYRTGYVKGFRRYRTELIKRGALEKGNEAQQIIDFPKMTVSQAKPNN